MAVASVEPEWRKLFAAYLTNIRRSLDPALDIITWCKKEGLTFADHCIDDIAVFQDLINRANDIYKESKQSFYIPSILCFKKTLILNLISNFHIF